MKGLPIFLIFLLIFGACTTTKYVPVVSTKLDSIYISQKIVDTIKEKDSIFVESKGDTVREVHYKYKYITRNQVDTFYKTSNDTIREQVFVEKPLSRWQQTKLWLADGLLSAIVILLLFYLFGRRTNT